MTKIFKVLTAGIFILLLGNNRIYAQWGVGQEIGIVAGPAAFYTDYGVRYSLETNFGNTGAGIGLVHYLNFAYSADCNCYTIDSYFNDHFKIRSEVNYLETELNHFGEIANKQNTGGEQLRAMIGSIKIFEIGAHLEYFPLSIRDYTAFAYPISPFISLGANFVTFEPYAYSTLGPLEENLFHSFKVGTGEMGGVDLDSGSNWSLVFGTGVRYKLGVSSDLVANLQWKYYFTDWLDGLNHDQPQNKFNDMVFWLSVGYIYYLNF
ncbi:MAG TPA: glutamate dehydrogenase [Salinimicrobium sp.]|nr:glutamate dehydrogenase [Salinimicrobium sp.]